MEEKKRSRVNITLSDELDDYFTARSVASGQAKSAVIGLALLEYLESKKALVAFGEFTDALKKEQALKQE